MPGPGDCACPLGEAPAFRDRRFRPGCRLQRPETGRTSACTEPATRLNKSANGSKANPASLAHGKKEPPQSPSDHTERCSSSLSNDG